MSTSTRTELFAALFAALCLALCTGALCAFSMAAGAEDFSKTVRYADLDLSKLEGAKTLYGRIRVAARQVCELSSDNTAKLRGEARVCIDKSIDQAVRSVNAPVLTKLRFGSSTTLLASH
jgi:UrcA family protein